MSDDAVYVSLLISSIGFSRVTRHPALLRSPELRKCSSTLFGVVIVAMVSGFHIAHPIFSIVLQVLLLKLTPIQHVHWISFAAGFSHLLFFRLCGSDIFNILPAAPAHTNAIQMILTLKMIGLAFEVHSSKSGKFGVLEREYRAVDPSVVDIFHYGLGHAGVLTGPYYKFRTFQDMYRSPWSFQADCQLAMWRRVARVPLYVAMFLISGHLFPLEAVKQDDFYDNSSLLYRMFYMTPVFFNFRMRLYSGFVLSECACIMAGLGAYPSASTPKPGSGPTDLEELRKLEVGSQQHDPPGPAIDFETVHNIFEYGAESATTMREALKTWNTTVQHWLATNVYQQLPRQMPRPLKAAAVMLVSSVWHGVYPGYYLSLGTVPFVLPVEDLYERILRRKLVDAKPVPWVNTYDWIAWFVRFQWFAYLGIAFQLLHVDVTLKFWRSVSYVGHLSLPLCYLSGVVLVKPLLNLFLPPKSAATKTD